MIEKLIAAALLGCMSLIVVGQSNTTTKLRDEIKSLRADNDRLTAKNIDDNAAWQKRDAEFAAIVDARVAEVAALKARLDNNGPPVAAPVAYTTHAACANGSCRVRQSYSQPASMGPVRRFFRGRI